jgi:2-polyprenyl-3-methyl-5-hydroxy-6-metoxy-1,4-benzoquinol methylase
MPHVGAAREAFVAASGSSFVMTEAELLAHYVERGSEPWSVSLEASWLDYELRAWFRHRLPARWPTPARVCNIGLGAGLFDDWLGHELGAQITSVGHDPASCRTFAARQRRERHPYPAHVRCGEVSEVLRRGEFDAITIVGSTLSVTDDRDVLERTALAALRPGGALLVADVGNREPPPIADEVRRLGEIWIAFRDLRCPTKLGH